LFAELGENKDKTPFRPIQIGEVYYLGKRVRNLVDSLKFRVMRLARGRGRKINFDVFSNPEKYVVLLPMEKIVADSKVVREGVEAYKRRIKSGEKVAPIIVVEHPKYDVYAVLDGHHRYYALLELGKKKIDCAIAGDISGVVFYMTKHGYFQPNADLRKGIHKQTLQFHENLQEFLDNFSKDPHISARPKRERE
jgi:hypothetical protein